ncbi:hypothetical protein GDO86_018226, partial [Hymenochirus boettgeri]
MAQIQTAPPTDMERNMEKIITIFQSFAGKEGDQAKMSYKEFEDFMKTELGSFTSNQKDPNILRKLMKSVDGGDTCPDGQLDFQEFLNLIGGMMVACNEALLRAPKQAPAPPPQKPPTKMEEAMEGIIRTFQQYAGKKGDVAQMDHGEFEDFMKTELKSFTCV